MLDGTIASIDAAVHSLGPEDDMRQVLVDPCERFKLDCRFEWTMETFVYSGDIAISTTQLKVAIKVAFGITRRPISITLAHLGC